MKKPNVIIAGAPKAGTTSLYEALRQHKDIYLPGYKEPTFFSDDQNYKWGLDYYLESYYGEVNNKKIVIDCSPLYFNSERAAKRIRDDLGVETKIIIIVREPVARAISHFLHDSRTDLKEDYRELVKGGAKSESISYGKYFSIIKMWEGWFGKENILLLQFENDISGNFQQGLDKICQFLEIDKFNPGKINISNSAQQGKKHLTWLRRWMLSANPCKDLVKRIMPPYVRQRARLILEQFTLEPKSGSVTRFPEIDAEIYQKFYEVEMEDLKREYGIDYTRRAAT